MKRLLTLVALVFTLSGCAAVQAWWSAFESDPVAQVQTFETDANILISNLTTAWDVLVVFLPANVAQQAQVQFNNAVAAINLALQALQDAVQAAVDAKNNAPDFSATILDVNNAIQAIVAIVNEYKTQQVTPTASATGATRPAVLPGLDAALAQQTNLKHFVVKVSH